MLVVGFYSRQPSIWMNTVYRYFDWKQLIFLNHYIDIIFGLDLIFDNYMYVKSEVPLEFLIEIFKAFWKEGNYIILTPMIPCLSTKITKVKWTSQKLRGSRTHFWKLRGLLENVLNVLWLDWVQTPKSLHRIKEERTFTLH